MEQEFLITAIKRIIMVEKAEYSGAKLRFSSNLDGNELIFHFSGKGILYFEDEVLVLQPGAVRFLPSGKFSRYEVHDYVPGDCIDIIFQADRPISNKAFIMNPAQSEYIGTLFKKIFSIWVGKSEGYYFECLSLLYKILAELQKHNYVPKEHFRMIKPAVELIWNHFLQSELKSSQLAGVCGISESYFKRLFKEKYGIPPKQYMIQMKINYACDLLRSAQYTVTQVADLCNFSDVYYFSRQFKRYLGITPTQFVKKYKSSK